MELNQLWEIVKPYLESAGTLLMGALAFYGWAKRVLNKNNVNNMAFDVSNSVKKSLSDKAVKLSITPVIEKEIAKVSEYFIGKIDSLENSLYKATDKINNMAEAISYSKQIPPELKQQLLNGKIVEVEKEQEVEINDLIVEKEQEKETTNSAMFE